MSFYSHMDMIPRWRRLRRAPLLIPAIGLVTGLALAVALTSGGGPPARSAPPRAAGGSTPGGAVATAACQVRYTVSSQWDTGFSTAVTIINRSGPISGWTLQYAYSGNQSLAGGWSGDWAQHGATVTVTSASWNGSLATGAAVQIGANFSYRGANPAPTGFRVNGMTCAGGPAAPPAASAPAASAPAGGATAAPAGPAPQLQVSGNKLVTPSGQPVVLHGVDRAGAEFECVQGRGIFDGPADQASVTAMKSFGVSAVRVPLNEACWNGESYVNPAYAGQRYRSAIENYVSLLNASGLAVILDLHWSDGAYTGPGSACSSARATCQKPMPDAAQAIPFWTSVARAFKGNDAVVFDLFNEPFPEKARGSSDAAGWSCWLTGGTCPGIGYPAAGMQSLVNAVRGTGANNVLMLGGLEWANDLSGWLSHEPSDPDHDLAVSWHSYNFNACNNQSCWTSQVAPVIASVPVIAGEIGENDCADSYIDPLMTWLDAEQTSYLGWAWNADFSCSGGPGLITSYNGTPTAYGAGFETHIASLAG
jgi:endoglucanase